MYNILCFLIWSSLQVSFTSCTVCPDGYTYFDGYCLYYSTLSTTWIDAKLDCATRNNGWLVSIPDANKSSIVNTNLPLVVTGSYWIGGTCGIKCTTKSDGGGIWKWESGESWSYTNWNTNKPNFQNNNEICLQMNTNDSTWDDTICTNIMPYVCSTNTVIHNKMGKDTSNTKFIKHAEDPILYISTAFSELPDSLSLIGSASISSSGLILTPAAGWHEGAMLVKSQFPYLSHTSFSIQYQTTVKDCAYVCEDHVAVWVGCEYVCADGIALLIGPYSTLASLSNQYENRAYEGNCPTGTFCVQQSEYNYYFQISVGDTVISSISPTDITDGEIKSISVTFYYDSGVTVVYQGTGGETYTLTATPSELSALDSSSIYGVMLYSRAAFYYASHTINNFQMLVSYKTMSPTTLPTPVKPTRVPHPPHTPRPLPEGVKYKRIHSRSPNSTPHRKTRTKSVHSPTSV